MIHLDTNYLIALAVVGSPEARGKVTENIGDRPVKRSVRAGMQNIRTGGTGLKSPISDGCGVCGKSRGEDCKKDSDE